MNSQFSDMTAFKEEPSIWIHPTDALKRGIGEADKVKVYNERGSFILKVMIT